MILRRNRLERGMTVGVLGTHGRRQLRSGADVARGGFLRAKEWFTRPAPTGGGRRRLRRTTLMPDPRPKEQQ